MSPDFPGPAGSILFVVGLILVLVWNCSSFPGTFIAGISGAVSDVRRAGHGDGGHVPGHARPSFAAAIATAVAGSQHRGRHLVRGGAGPRSLSSQDDSLFHQLVSQTASGVSSVAAMEDAAGGAHRPDWRDHLAAFPGGKARFGEELLDVITRGELVEKGRPVKIIGHSGGNAIVEEVRQAT